MLAKAHTIAPAGAATITALRSTRSVRSYSERHSTWATWGMRYGGSSRMKEDGTPRSTVRESAHDMPNEAATPRSTMAATRSDAVVDPAAIKHANAIRVGNLPLHGAKLLVKIATRRSRGESIILHAMTPAALHPNPMAMDRQFSVCFPLLDNTLLDAILRREADMDPDGLALDAALLHSCVAALPDLDAVYQPEE